MMWTVGEIDLFPLAVGWALAIPPVVAAHMVLNMRKEYRKDSGIDTEDLIETHELQIRAPTKTSDLNSTLGRVQTRGGSSLDSTLNNSGVVHIV